MLAEVHAPRDRARLTGLLFMCTDTARTQLVTHTHYTQLGLDTIVPWG